MKLITPKVELFYATWCPLLRWVHEVRGVIPGLELRDDATNDPNDLIKIRDALWADDALLDAFVARNPAGLSDRALALAASWKHRRAGTCIVFRALKAHTVVIEDGPAGAVYAVLGLSRSVAEIPPWLPCLVDGVLLPFEGRIVFDGLLRCFSVHIGPGIRRQLNDVYRGAKGRVVTSLGDASSLQVAAPSAAPVKAKPRPSTARRAKAPEPVDPSQFPGRCEGCDGVFSKRAIGRHLEGCAKVAALGGRGKAVTRYELVVESPHLPMYWMVLDVPASATLASIDRVLRDTWLECCGHLSEFRIGDVTFASNPDREYGPTATSAACARRSATSRTCRDGNTSTTTAPPPSCGCAWVARTSVRVGGRGCSRGTWRRRGRAWSAAPPRRRSARSAMQGQTRGSARSARRSTRAERSISSRR